MKNLLKYSSIALLAVGISACNDSDDSTDTSSLTVDVQGLENLGPDYAYEGWIMVDGAPQTAGIFTIDDEGNASQTSLKSIAKTSRQQLPISLLSSLVQILIRHPAPCT